MNKPHAWTAEPKKPKIAHRQRHQNRWTEFHDQWALQTVATISFSCCLFSLTGFLLLLSSFFLLIVAFSFVELSLLFAFGLGVLFLFP